MSDRVHARYWIESSQPLEKAAAIMAGEQSTGTFVRVAGETDELREAHAARVEELQELGQNQAEVCLSWPLSNMGPSLPNLLATVAGNLFELKPFTGLRLLDLELPLPFHDRYQGPQFGSAGTRRQTGVTRLPLVGTIIKPSVGLSPAATAAIVESLCEGGIDFIKDDELQADGPHCPFADRFAAISRVLNRHAERTGRRVMYACNITGEIDEMLAREETVASGGGTCVMVSINSIGMPALVALRRNARTVIHGHRNGWGLFSRSPQIGMSFIAYQKFWRVAGVDHLHVNGLANKFSESDQSVIASARECLKAMFPAPATGFEIMPVFSSGQTARQVSGTWAALQSTDLIFACGGGIMAHPGGIAAGVRAIRQAWEAALAGISLEQQARTHRELKEALEAFAS